MSKGLANATAALRVADFRLYLITNCVSLIGLWIQRVAVQALAWNLTGSMSWLGIIALVDLAPALVIGPLAGAIADRFDRKRLAYITQVISILQAALLAVVTLSGVIDIRLLFILTAVGGINTAFWAPVRQSIVPNLVPREHLSTAVALGSLNFNLARFIGPAIAGPIIVFANIGSAFAANACSYLGFLVALHFISVPRGPQSAKKASNNTGADGDRGLFSDMVDGLKYVTRHKGIGPLLLFLFLGGTALRPLVELLRGFAEMAHGQGEAGFAMLTSAMGAGALLVSIWLALRSSEIDHFKAIVASGFCGGALLIILAFMPWFSGAIVVVALAAAAITVNGVSGQILLQLTVPDAMRGRVLSMYTAIFRGTPAVGAIIIGVIADLAGIAWPLAGAGVAALLVFAALALNRARLATHFTDAEATDKI